MHHDDALKVWRCYLEGEEVFTVFTDHRANTFLAVQPTLSRRQTRSVEYLSRFHIKWTFKKGVDNPPDPSVEIPLSRLATCLLGSLVIQQLDAMTRGIRKRADATVPEPYQDVNETFDELVQPPERSPEPRKSWQTRIEEAYAKDPSLLSVASTDGSELKGALWCREGKVALPNADNLRQGLMLERHNSLFSGRVGFHKTLKSISRYYW